MCDEIGRVIDAAEAFLADVAALAHALEAVEERAAVLRTRRTHTPDTAREVAALRAAVVDYGRVAARAIQRHNELVGEVAPGTIGEGGWHDRMLGCFAGALSERFGADDEAAASMADPAALLVATAAMAIVAECQVATRMAQNFALDAVTIRNMEAMLDIIETGLPPRRRAANPLLVPRKVDGVVDILQHFRDLPAASTAAAEVVETIEREAIPVVPVVPVSSLGQQAASPVSTFAPPRPTFALGLTAPVVAPPVVPGRGFSHLMAHNDALTRAHSDYIAHLTRSRDFELGAIAGRS
jgi:hypothetical protein